jgi:hypothetical protein
VRSGLSEVGVQVGALGVDQVCDSVEQQTGDNDTVVCRCPGGSPATLKGGR